MAVRAGTISTRPKPPAKRPRIAANVKSTANTKHIITNPAFFMVFTAYKIPPTAPFGTIRPGIL
jgi:hypothetical protein